MSKYTRIKLFAFHNGLETSRIHSSLEGTVIALCFMIVIGASVQVFWLKGHRPAVVVLLLSSFAAVLSDAITLRVIVIIIAIASITEGENAWQAHSAIYAILFSLWRIL